MKKIIKAVVTVSALASMILVPTFSASAVGPYLDTGDVDNNGRVDVNDVTLLQNYLAGDATLSPYEAYAGDVDFNRVNDVVDVSLIQSHIAGDYKFIRRSTPIYFNYVVNLNANFDSGKAMVGMPVTFVSNAYNSADPFTYEYLVNGEVVQPKSSADTFTYTFSKSGTYKITLNCYNAFDVCNEKTIYYTVVDPYESDTPVICGIHTDDEYISKGSYNVTITANTIFGTAPYQYKFTLDNGLLVQDYSENSDFFINMYKLNYKDNTPLEIGDHTVLVEVKDANGNTASEVFTFYVGENKLL